MTLAIVLLSRSPATADPGTPNLEPPNLAPGTRTPNPEPRTPNPEPRTELPHDWNSRVVQETLLMRPHVERRRAGEKSRFGVSHRIVDGADEGGVQFDDDFLCLHRADRHAARGRGECPGEQAVSIPEKHIGARQIEHPTGSPDNHRVVRRG